jgi:tetratricopeptide (TPR) repeat protein
MKLTRVLALLIASASVHDSACAAAWQETPPEAERGAADDDVAPAPVEDEAAQRARRRATELIELATLLELGLPAQLVAHGLPLVSEGGLLADDGRAVAYVAHALFEAGREQEAETLLARAVVLPETGGAIELAWARIDLARDELDRALARLVDDEGRPRLANDPEAWILTARVLARRGNLTAAVPYLRRFVELAPFHSETVAAFHMLHLEAAARHDVDAATRLRVESERRRRAFEVIRARTLQVRAAPDDPLPLFGLGLGFLELGDTVVAAEVLTQLLTRHPEFQRGWFQLGEARRMSGDLYGALAAFDEGVARDPLDHNCRLNRALVRLVLGDRDPARADFEYLRTSPVGNDPTYCALYLGLARLYKAEGDTTSSQQAYARYQELGGTEPLVPR